MRRQIGQDQRVVAQHQPRFIGHGIAARRGGSGQNVDGKEGGGARSPGGAGGSEGQPAPGIDPGHNRLVRTGWRRPRRHRQLLAANDVTARIHDHETRASGDLRGEHALRTRAARRIAGVCLKRVERYAQRCHVADQLDRELAGTFGGGDAELRLGGFVGQFGGAQRRKEGNDSERQ
ncbi:hypothetical protein D9M73_139410 [compost metagenome]